MLIDEMPFSVAAEDQILLYDAPVWTITSVASPSPRGRSSSHASPTTSRCPRRRRSRVRTGGEVLKQVATRVLHLGLADVSKRGEVEQTIGRPLDWSALQDREAAIASPLLRANAEGFIHPR